jgi:hypothetical protein
MLTLVAHGLTLAKIPGENTDQPLALIRENQLGNFDLKKNLLEVAWGCVNKCPK